MFRLSLARQEATIVARCEVEALRHYISEHNGKSGGSELLGVDVHQIDTLKSKRPNGNTLVTVSVHHKHAHRSETYVYRLRYRGRRVFLADEMRKGEV